MNVRVTAVMALVLALLIAYLRLSTPSAPPAPTVTEQAPLLAVPVDGVARLELRTPLERLTLVRTPTGWRDEAERVLPSGVVLDLLGALATLRPITMVDAAPGAIDDYGLGADATHLRLAGADDRTLLELEVGRRNPAWTALYARRAGDPGVFLIGALLQWELEKLRDTADARSSP